MSNSVFVTLTPEEYEHLLRAVVMYDAVRGRITGGPEISPTQERWFAEGEKLGMWITDGEREKCMVEVYDDLDDFVDEETWEQLAWLFADREVTRRAAGSRDEDSCEVMAHRYYHEFADELHRHGIDHLDFSDLKVTTLSPATVRSALEQYRMKSPSLLDNDERA